MTPSLCNADAATFWAWRRWPEFTHLKAIAATVVIVPIVGFCEWDPNQPLDTEETLLLSVLRAASESRTPDQTLLVTPPLRFVVGPDARCAFAVDVPTAHAFIAEVAASVVTDGFRRIVLLNSSPWNEELVAAASRDLRIALRAQFFTIHLSALGLDFHARRAPDHSRLIKAIECGGDAAAAIHLRGLLAEIQAHPPLAQGGRIFPAQL